VKLLIRSVSVGHQRGDFAVIDLQLLCLGNDVTELWDQHLRPGAFLSEFGIANPDAVPTSTKISLPNGRKLCLD
jgi:hypothetical protein